MRETFRMLKYSYIFFFISIVIKVKHLFESPCHLNNVEQCYSFEIRPTANTSCRNLSNGNKRKIKEHVLGDGFMKHIQLGSNNNIEFPIFVNVQI